MRPWWLLLVLVACKGGTRPDGAIDTIKAKGTTFEKLHLKFGKGDSVDLDFAIRDPKGNEVTDVKLMSPLEPFEVQLLAGPQIDTMNRPDSERPRELCRATMLSPEFDKTTKRLRVSGQMRTGNRECKQVLLEEGYTGKYFIHFFMGYAGEVNTEVTVDLQDTRVAKLPEVDAELDKLDASIKAIDVEKTYPPCTAALLVREIKGKKGVPYMEGIDLRAIGASSDDWWWATSDFFDTIESYKKRRSASSPQALVEWFKVMPFALVYVATTTKMPVRKADSFDSGEYDARALVIDRAAGGPICEVAFQARSSQTIDFTTRVERRKGGAETKLDDDATLQLQLDFKGQIQRAAFDAVAKAATEQK
jgi:hypothetical protein